MSLAQHRRATKIALTGNDDIGRIIAQLGTADAPRGRIIRAYANAKRALKGNTDDLGALTEALQELKLSVEASIRDAAAKSINSGLKQARAMLNVYDEPFQAVDTQMIEELAVRLVVDQANLQINAAEAGLRAGLLTEEQVIGDAGRVGLLSYGVVLKAASQWLANAHNSTYEQVLTKSVKQVYVKQAIAAIDERTTDCCLKVSGQVQPLNKKFILTGTPRYADEMERPPFHWYCRTTTAMVLEQDADDEHTREIRAAAQAELTVREETGTIIEIHPASSISRR